MTPITRSIPRWVWGWTALFLLFGSLPFIIGWRSAGADRTFSGVLINGLDTNSYLADMQLGLHGRWLYVLPYTPQRSTPVPLFMVYILLGHAAHLTGLSLPLIFHLARLLCGGLFALAAYRFIARRLPDPAEQRLALGMLLFTGGLGWIMLILFGGRLSSDLREMPDLALSDAVSFMAMASNPHFTLNMALMMWMITTGGAFVARGGRRDGWQAVTAGAGIAFVHAHQVAIVGLVLGGIAAPGVAQAFFSAQKDSTQRSRALHEIGRLAVVMGPVVALAGGLTLLTQRDPYLASWLKQGNTYTPPVWSLFILYGPLLPLALAGAWHIMKTSRAGFSSPDILLDTVWWFAAVLALIYVPVNFQRRFMEGWHVPVAMLAAVGWFRVAVPALRKRFPPRAIKGMLAVLLGSVMLSTLFAFTYLIVHTLWADAYITADERGAISWLNRHASLDDVVLAYLDDGNQLPARASVRSFAGHWSLTAFAADRLHDVEHFYAASTPDSDRIALLRRFDVRYVYVSPVERRLGTFDPAKAAYLIPVYTSPTVQLYEVANAGE